MAGEPPNQRPKMPWDLSQGSLDSEDMFSDSDKSDMEKDLPDELIGSGDEQSSVSGPKPPAQGPGSGGQMASQQQLREDEPTDAMHRQLNNHLRQQGMQNGPLSGRVGVGDGVGAVRLRNMRRAMQILARLLAPGGVVPTLAPYIYIHLPLLGTTRPAVYRYIHPNYVRVVQDPSTTQAPPPQPAPAPRAPTATQAPPPQPAPAPRAPTATQAPPPQPAPAPRAPTATQAPPPQHAPAPRAPTTTQAASPPPAPSLRAPAATQAAPPPPTPLVLAAMQAMLRATVAAHRPPPTGSIAAPIRIAMKNLARMLAPGGGAHPLVPYIYIHLPRVGMRPTILRYVHPRYVHALQDPATRQAAQPSPTPAQRAPAAAQQPFPAGFIVGLEKKWKIHIAMRNLARLLAPGGGAHPLAPYIYIHLPREGSMRPDVLRYVHPRYVSAPQAAQPPPAPMAQAPAATQAAQPPPAPMAQAPAATQAAQPPPAPMAQAPAATQAAQPPPAPMAQAPAATQAAQPPPAPMAQAPAATQAAQPPPAPMAQAPAATQAAQPPPAPMAQAPAATQAAQPPPTPMAQAPAATQAAQPPLVPLPQAPATAQATQPPPAPLPQALAAAQDTQPLPAPLPQAPATAQATQPPPAPLPQAPATTQATQPPPAPLPQALAGVQAAQPPLTPLPQAQAAAQATQAPPAPMLQTPAAAQAAELLRVCTRFQQKLWLLQHAQWCQEREFQSNRSGETWQCSLPHCKTMKGLLNHAICCQARQHCVVPDCHLSKIVAHQWNGCKINGCQLCLLLKQTLKAEGERTEKGA